MGRWSNTIAVTVTLAMSIAGNGHGQPQAQPAGAMKTAPSEEDAAYIRMAIEAARLIKDIANGRTVAMYQTNSQSAVIRGVAAGVIETYGFREIHPGDEAYQCTPQPRRPRTVIDGLANCTINVGDILVQLNSVQLSKDSGYVGGLVTQTVRGDARPRTSAVCLTAVRRGAAWVAATHTDVPTPRDCAQDRKH
jgi:hypothetical protein